MTEPKTDCGCHADEELLANDAGYRKALGWVVALNLGFGFFEVAGGFLADSQALKADALDFLGDGSITMVGLFALAWTARTRAKVAMAQGVFLAAMGMAVLAFAIWRSLIGGQPEADLMGGIALAALAVNVAAALILARYRKQGDAQARAIWLFSRNDALGNLAVVIAAGLVAWTGSAWPDLVVAAAIAALFLASSWRVIMDARAELKSLSTLKGEG